LGRSRFWDEAYSRYGNIDWVLTWSLRCRERVIFRRRPHSRDLVACDLVISCVIAGIFGSIVDALLVDTVVRRTGTCIQ
jgi:hypothetical protein